MWRYQWTENKNATLERVSNNCRYLLSALLCFSWANFDSFKKRICCVACYKKKSHLAQCCRWFGSELHSLPELLKQLPLFIIFNDSIPIAFIFADWQYICMVSTSHTSFNIIILNFQVSFHEGWRCNVCQ